MFDLRDCAETVLVTCQPPGGFGGTPGGLAALGQLPHGHFCLLVRDVADPAAAEGTRAKHGDRLWRERHGPLLAVLGPPRAGTGHNLLRPDMADGRRPGQRQVVVRQLNDLADPVISSAAFPLWRGLFLAFARSRSQSGGLVVTWRQAGVRGYGCRLRPARLPVV